MSTPKLLSENKHSTLLAKHQLLADHLLPFFGDSLVSEVSSAQLDEFRLLKLKAGYSPKSVNNMMTVLRRLVELASTRGLTASVPKFEWLKVGHQGFDFLDPHRDEDRALVAGADWEFRPMLVLALQTGLRSGELLALRWEDWLGRVLRVRRTVYREVEGLPKGGREREAPLTAAALCAISERRQRALGAYVFHTHGSQMTEGQLKWPLWRACDAAGLRRVRMHVLRHTFASTLVMAGVPLAKVQVLMGHASITQTQRYAHLSPISLAEGAAAISDRIQDLDSVFSLSSARSPAARLSRNSSRNGDSPS